MNRPNWYSDEPVAGGRFQVPPFRMWTATQQLLSALAVVFLLQLTLGVQKPLELRFDELHNPLQWYRFVSYALVHDQRSLAHLAFNAVSIWFFGTWLESELGTRRRYFGFCAAAAAFAGVSWLVVELLRSQPLGALIGVSGVAYAMIVALATADPHRPVMLIVIPMRAWVLALILMLFALFLSLMQPGAGVAHVAHLGGGAFGFLWVRGRGRIDAILGDLDRRRNLARRRKEVELRHEVDRLLEKIHTTGMTSLTRSERRYLESASRELQRKR